MHIGYDGSRINIGNRTGTENYSYQILKHMLEIDVNNEYTIYSRLKIEEPELLTKNAANKVINLKRLWTQLGLALEVIKNKPDVLFVPAHTMPVLRKPTLKTVVTIHDLGAEYLPEYHQFPAKLYLNRSTEYAAKYATHLIAVSEFTKKDLVEKMGVDPSRVSVIYLGVDLTEMKRQSEAKVKKVKQKYKIDQEYILFIGTIQPRKNLIGLIEAYAKLAPQNIQLVLAGGKGWLSEEIYAAPARLHIEERVKFLGYIDEDDKASLYSGAQATALVSHFEGFGLPMVESMACGTPVIAANASCLPEIVGNAGVLVDPKNIDDIAQGLGAVLKDDQLRKRLIKDGYEQATKFSWQDAAKQTLALLEKVAKE